MTIEMIDGVLTLSRGSTNIKYLVTPDGVEAIKNYAFWGDPFLERITIGGKITKTGIAMCLQCPRLTSVIILEGVEDIAPLTFAYCPKLNHVVFARSVRSIDENAFNGCSSLQSITLYEGIQQIASSAFEDCIALKQIIIDASNAEDFKRIKALLPAALQQFAISKKRNSDVNAAQNYLVNDFLAKVNGIDNIVFLKPNNIIDIASFLKSEEQLIKTFQTIPLGQAQDDFQRYKDLLEVIQRKHLVAVQLQKYAHILYVAIQAQPNPSPSFFPVAKLHSNARDVCRVVQKVITWLHTNNPFELSVDEQALMQSKPLLLSKIPLAMRQELGLDMVNDTYEYNKEGSQVYKRRRT